MQDVQIVGKVSIRIEVRDPEPGPNLEQLPTIAWKTVEVNSPTTGGKLELCGHGIPHRTYFVTVEEPARKGEPYTGLIHAPSEHIQHMLEYGWVTDEQAAMAA
ncbi:MAG: hypothetical protein AB199_03235 [Parcubacteria bacterium C7867-004]|nr:MAG: hypothetical protein AB199_03235 [Parcubacteria bacterium C7867-004]